MDFNDSLDSGEKNSSNDEDQLTKRKNLVMEQVFQIPLIFEQIIQETKNLSDLKQCRLVSSNWKETTTKMMLQRDSAIVELDFNYRAMEYKKFIHLNTNYYPLCTLIDEKYAEDHDDVLTSLNEILNKSTQFPCSTFMIHGGNLSDPKMEDFFKAVGESIKHLALTRDSRKSAKLFELLELNCPNLETLFVEGVVIDLSLMDISFDLPKLKKLHMKNASVFEHSFQILTSLIAPNLQVIKGLSIYRDLEAIAQAGKIHCVKELNFIIFGIDVDLTKLEMFTQFGPQLKILNVCLRDLFNSLDYDAKSKRMRLIQKLLDLSKTTLRSFSFEGIEAAFRYLNFPQFPQLQEIEIDSRNASQKVGVVKYPYEILGGDISPNLQVIKGFNLDRDTEQVVRAGKIYCVKRLHLYHGRFELEHLRLFSSVRPKLEILELGWMDNRVEMNLRKTREMISLLEQLLELSKDTLKSFQFDGVGAVFKKIKFPKFSKLEHVVVATGPIRIFPKGINLTDTFPKLEILDLHRCNHFHRDKNWNKYFPPRNAFIGCLTSVQTLIVNPQFTDAAKENIRIMCPNAKVAYSF